MVEFSEGLLWLDVTPCPPVWALRLAVCSWTYSRHDASLDSRFWEDKVVFIYNYLFKNYQTMDKTSLLCVKP